MLAQVPKGPCAAHPTVTPCERQEGVAYGPQKVTAEGKVKSTAPYPPAFRRDPVSVMSGES